MKRFIAVVVAIAAVVVMAETETQAQSYMGGYQFGAGIQAPCGIGGFRSTPREQPPYFAQFPPVYYSHIVKRPYGISPYAAPAGIAPVEMSFPMAPPTPPITKVNPYYSPNVEPIADQTEVIELPSQPATQVENKVTWQANPFFTNKIEGVASK